jgi:high-affinity iron transporter
MTTGAVGAGDRSEARVELGAWFGGLLTGLREGVEAALIVAIILAYLVRTGHAERAGRIWLGTALAALVSIVAGVALFVTVGELPSPAEQVFEGATMLLAAGVVTWMLFWMRRQAIGMRGELNAAVERVLTEGSATGLAVLAFTAVIREGIETSLFLVGQATSADQAAPSVLLGAVTGLAGAAAVGWLFYTGSRRVDLRSFFRWTGAGLIFIAAGLLSHAVHEFVEIGVIGVATHAAYDVSAWLPDDAGLGAFLRAILGYSASPEVVTLMAHVAYLAVVLALFFRPARPMASSAPRAAESTTGTSG